MRDGSAFQLISLMSGGLDARQSSFELLRRFEKASLVTVTWKFVRCGYATCVVWHFCDLLSAVNV
jgi:hypothetical protein